MSTFRIPRLSATYLMHITNTLYPIIGTCLSVNISANLSSPRPLLVVHSGNTTIGRSTVFRISSRLLALAALSSRGTCAVAQMMESNDTRRNPVIGIGVLTDLVEVECIAAEPVPVRLPGVFMTGIDSCEAGSGVICELTGRTKTGLNLIMR